MVWATPQRFTMMSPHLRYLLVTAIRRKWHSVLLTGLDQADEYLWERPECLEGVLTSGSQSQSFCSQSKNERAAWALLSIMSGSPLWLLVASCCPTTTNHQVPVCGRPMQLLLSFLTGPGSLNVWEGVSLDLGCNPRYQFVRLSAGEASTEYTSRAAFRRWAGRGKYARLPPRNTTE